MTNPPPITLAERQSRLAALRTQMDAAGVKAVLLGATASLRYFTGLVWHASERLCGAIVHANGRLEYVCPAFEREKVAGIVGVPGEILTWEEHENPTPWSPAGWGRPACWRWTTRSPCSCSSACAGPWATSA